jgi:hypothetical protein
VHLHEVIYIRIMILFFWAGADIIMALDDVVSSVNTSPERYCSPHWVPLISRMESQSHAGTHYRPQGYGYWHCRFKEATHRTTRWIDRCIKAHSRPNEQNLFAIVQGGLDEKLRAISIKELSERGLPGYAIGGLAGGESKDDFWRYNVLWPHAHADMQSEIFAIKGKPPACRACFSTFLSQGGGSVHGSRSWPPITQAKICHGCWVSS